MPFRRGYGPFVLLLMAAGCGGSVLSQKADGTGGSAGGSNVTGGSSTQAGSTSSAGQPSAGGSSASGGSGSLGGSLSMGGSVAAAGMVGVAGSGGTDGCLNVSCTRPMACAMGYTLGQPPGACCAGCIPDPGGVACPKIACGEVTCPLGYVRGDLVGGCCSACLPDPLFCNDDSECLLAEKPDACCSCPNASNLRGYAADPCLSNIAAPRMVPTSCKPAGCVGSCAPCAAAGSPRCELHRCVNRPIGAK